MRSIVIVVLASVALATQGCESAGGGRSSRDAASGDLGQDVSGPVTACDLPAAQLPGAVCDDENGVVWLANGDNPECQAFTGPGSAGPLVLPDRCKPFFCSSSSGDLTGYCTEDGGECNTSCAHDPDCAHGYTCQVY